MDANTGDKVRITFGIGKRIYSFIGTVVKIMDGPPNVYLIRHSAPSNMITPTGNTSRWVTEDEIEAIIK